MTTLTWPVLHHAASGAKAAGMHDTPADTADEDLVRASLKGDDGAFAELIARHKGRVFGTCSRFASDAPQIDDLAQEVFVRAWRKLSGFRGDAPFEHWLARLTITTCYDFVRKEKRHRGHASLDEMPVDMPDRNIERAVASGSARELLEWAMAQLAADDCLILNLLEIEERSVREISGLTKWSESNVKVRAFRARARLKEILNTTNEI